MDENYMKSTLNSQKNTNFANLKDYPLEMEAFYTLLN